jgi:hypothetical protein
MTQISLDHGFLDTTAASSVVPQTTPAVRKGAYPRHYAWVLALAVLDIIVTALVLSTGGKEMNAIARWAIEHAGVIGMVAIKATTLTIVLCICEYLGRHRPKVGLRIAEFALIANSAAVACGLVYLTQFSIVLLQWM